MTLISNSAQLTGRANGHHVDADVLANGQLRVIAYSQDQLPFHGTDGDIVQVGFHIDGAGGSYSLQPSNVIISDASAENIVSDAYGSQLTIAAGDIQAVNSIDYGSVSVLETTTANLTLQNVGNDDLVLTNLVSNNNKFTAAVSL